MARPAPRWRSEPDVVRAAVVRAGVDLMAQEGAALGVERVSLERAAAAARVSRAAAYRLWRQDERSPRDAFHLDVIRYVAEELVVGTDDEAASTIGAATEVLAAAGPPEQLDPRELGALLRRVVAAAAEANVRALTDSTTWHVYVAVLAGVGSQTFADEPIGADTQTMLDALRAGVATAALRYAGVYLAMADLFGLRLKEGYRIEEFGTAAGILAEGVALRAGLSPFDRVAEGPYGNESRGVSLFAPALLGLVREFFEADPAAERSVDLTLT